MWAQYCYYGNKTKQLVLKQSLQQEAPEQKSWLVKVVHLRKKQNADVRLRFFCFTMFVFLKFLIRHEHLFLFIWLLMWAANANCSV